MWRVVLLADITSNGAYEGVSSWIAARVGVAAAAKTLGLAVLLPASGAGVAPVLVSFVAGAAVAALFTANRLVAKTEREAQTDFSRIFGELGETAWLIKAGAEIEVPLENLQVRDIVIVRAGEMIPVDGYVLNGEALVDQHLLTGESQPVEKKTGDSVFTSTLLISGSLLNSRKFSRQFSQ